jgi:hypothetical protein
VKGEEPKFEASNQIEVKQDHALVNAGIEQTISLENEFEARFEKESLFQSEAIKLSKAGKINGSPIFELGSMYIPVNQKISIRLNAENYPESLRDQLIVMRKTGSKTLPLKSLLKDNWIETITGDFGDFWLVADTIGPSVTFIQNAPKYKIVKKGKKKIKVPIDNSEMPKASGVIKFKISDRLSGIGSVQAFLNDNWFLLEPGDDPSVWSYKLPDSLEFGCHIIEIVAIDNIGNKSEFELELEKNPPRQEDKKEN